MGSLADSVVSFFLDNFPSGKAFVLGGPPALLFAVLCLYLSGLLKKRKGLKTGYTRKIFHFLIFTSAAAVQAIFGTPGVCLFGGMVSLVIFYAVVRGDGHILYEALAREKDLPHRTHYILAPYFATLIGGLASNILFKEAAVVGYLVTGLGDAIGEPVGTRFGRHVYRVPALRGVAATRSLEGSAAVFMVCLPAIAAGIALCPSIDPASGLAYWIPIIALACTLVEAVSPHGWDNATLQILPSFLVWWIF